MNTIKINSGVEVVGDFPCNYPDAIIRHREEFEEWANGLWDIDEGYELNYGNELIRMAWKAWLASRGVFLINFDKSIVR